MMNKKLNEFKSFIISELTENMKVLIQSELHFIQEYKNHFEKFTPTVAMLQQYMTILMQENSNPQEETRKNW